MYIFRPNNELLISLNGKVEKAKWDYIGHRSLLIDLKEASYLFKHSFFDENIVALKIDSKEEYAFFVNEDKYSGEFNSIAKIIDFLKITYENRSNPILLGKYKEQNVELKELGATNRQTKDESEFIVLFFIIFLFLIVVALATG